LARRQGVCASLALLLGHERFAVLNVVPDVGVARTLRPVLLVLECGRLSLTLTNHVLRAMPEDEP
jgi:hypothetical protein